MRHSLLTATALGAALLLAPPLAAQTPQGGAAMGTMPRSSDRADTGMMQGRDVEALLRQADAAVGRGNWSQANEYAERAETTLLNTHVLGGSIEAGHVQGQAMRSVAEAREAIGRRDRSRARSALQTAMNDAGRAGQASAMPPTAGQPSAAMPGRTGAATGPAFGAGGGGAPAAGMQLQNPTGTAGAVPPGFGTPGMTQPPGSGMR